MNTKSKVRLLDVIALSCSWVWLIASGLAIYFLISAVFLDGSWTRFFVACTIGVAGKWLWSGFEENKYRAAYEGSLVELGLDPKEAMAAWDTLQKGGPDRLRMIREKVQSTR